MNNAVPLAAETIEIIINGNINERDGSSNVNNYPNIPKNVFLFTGTKTDVIVHYQIPIQKSCRRCIRNKFSCPLNDGAEELEFRDEVNVFK